jgi:hypothetical protein
MLTSRKLATLIALVLAVATFTAASAQGSAGSTIISDKFDEDFSTNIADHTPNTDTVGTGWVVERGIWRVNDGSAREATNIYWRHILDRRAVIDAGTADKSVEVEVKVDDFDVQFWGVVARQSGELDWTMAFQDDIGDIVLGVKDANEDQWGEPYSIYNPDAIPAGFQELGRVHHPMEKQRKSHKLKLVVNGDNIEVFADGQSVITATDTNHAGGTNAGIFARGMDVQQFLKFTVTQGDTGGGGSKGGGGKGGPKGGSSSAPLLEPTPTPTPEPEPEVEEEEEEKGKKGKGKKGDPKDDGPKGKGPKGKK